MDILAELKKIIEELLDLEDTEIVRCDQPRSLDLRARGAKKLETVPNHIIGEVLGKVSSLFE